MELELRRTWACIRRYGEWNVGNYGAILNSERQNLRLILPANSVVVLQLL
jgi:hypothetical protein